MIMVSSPVGRVGREVGGDLALPPVAVVEEFLLVEEQLLPALGGEFEVRPLDNRIDGAGLLAQPAVDALRHVDVVTRRASAAVGARLRLDGDRLRRADRLAQLAGDAALLAVGIAAQRMLAAEAGAEGALLIGIVDGNPRPEEIGEREPEPRQQLGQEQAAPRARQNGHRALLPGPGGLCRRTLKAATRRPAISRPWPPPRRATTAGTPSSPAASAGRSDSAGRSRAP